GRCRRRRPPPGRVDHRRRRSPPRRPDPRALAGLRRGPARPGRVARARRRRRLGAALPPRPLAGRAAPRGRRRPGGAMTRGSRWAAAALTVLGIVITTEFARPVLTLPGALALALVAGALPWWQWAVAPGRAPGTPRMWLCLVALPFVAAAGFAGVT